MSNNWHQEETYKSMIQISSVVMKFIFTANGGAAVALLTFMGQLRAKDIAPPELSCALLFFLLGVLFGGLEKVKVSYPQINITYQCVLLHYLRYLA